MSKYNECVHMVLDQLKLISDDKIYQEEHIMFLLSKYRAFLLKLRYSDIKKFIPEANYLTVCLDMELVPAIEGLVCGEYYLKSVQEVPYTIPVGISRITPLDYFGGIMFSLVDWERFKYVGFNRWLSKFIYATVGLDRHLYMKANDLAFLKYLQKVRYTGVFDEIEDVFDLLCDKDGICDILESEFPIESALIPPMIELCVKELSGAIYRPKDESNNAKDDLSNIPTL